MNIIATAQMPSATVAVAKRYETTMPPPGLTARCARRICRARAPAFANSVPALSCMTAPPYHNTSSGRKANPGRKLCDIASLRIQMPIKAPPTNASATARKKVPIGDPTVAADGGSGSSAESRAVLIVGRVPTLACALQSIARRGRGVWRAAGRARRRRTPRGVSLQDRVRQPTTASWRCPASSVPARLPERGGSRPGSRGGS